MVKIFYTRDVDYLSKFELPTDSRLYNKGTHIHSRVYTSFVLIKYRSLRFYVVPSSSGIYPIRITFLPYRRANRVNVAVGREKYIIKLGDRVEKFSRSLSLFRNTCTMIMYRIFFLFRLPDVYFMRAMNGPEFRARASVHCTRILSQRVRRVIYDCSKTPSYIVIIIAAAATAGAARELELFDGIYNLAQGRRRIRR